MYKVLVVEDEKRIRRGLIYRTDWKALGCSVPLEAANGREGLHQILEHRPDIVITDVKMPLKDGITMLSEGLEHYSFESIIISGYDEFSYAQTALRLGVTDYLLKPIDLNSLQETMKKICAKIAKKDIYQQIESLVEVHQEIPVVLDRRLYINREKGASRRVGIMLSYIFEQYQQRISLKALADEIEVSSTYLNKKFKEETGYTFNEFLNRYRIQKAVDEMQRGDYRIYELANMTGFRDYRYFVTVFKKYVGCAPTEFSAGAQHLQNEEADLDSI